MLRGLGVTGVQTWSTAAGCRRDDRITPAALVQPHRRGAARPAGGCGPRSPACRWRASPARWPRGGSVFAEPGRAALGVVRAKTGNLNTVATLAGVAYARDGQLLSFAVMADKLKSGALDRPAPQIASVATALAGCGCR